uniref:Single-stranded DNA-binding protein n=1 Tax=Opuntia streptacantha TaxID=393608 RepID=A0A7C8YGX4_OPUST
MATSGSLGAISRRLCRSLLSTQRPFCYHSHIPKSWFSTGPSAPDYNSDLDEASTLNSYPESSDSVSGESSSASSSPEPTRQRVVSEYALEGGLDVGIYKAILVGQVGQNPLQKRLKNGRMVTLTTIGTGGIRNERIPFPNEEPREYADRCNVQWHRVSIYPDKLSEIVMKHCQPGTILYIEGNLETKIFTDQITGLVRRVREIAVRRNGRVVFLGSDGEFNQPSFNELKGVGYF